MTYYSKIIKEKLTYLGGVSAFLIYGLNARKSYLGRYDFLAYMQVTAAFVVSTSN